MSSPTATLSSSTSPPSISIPARRKSRVSAEHTLTRVRENQRRHRARRRDYIATLEIQLAETELQLEAARAEIAMLRAGQGLGSTSSNEEPREEMPGWDGDGVRRGYVVEFESMETGGEVEVEVELGRASVNKQAALDLLALRQEMGGVAFDMGMETEYATSTSGSTPASASTSTSTSTSPSASSLPIVLIDEPHSPECLPPAMSIPTGPPPCCTDTPTPLPLPNPSLPTATTPPPSSAGPECTTCATRPAPSPSESTTLCSQAYMLISQQNFRQIDAGTIRLWLWQGYRRAQRRGEGCRVENGVLLSVLDFISGEL